MSERSRPARPAVRICRRVPPLRGARRHAVLAAGLALLAAPAVRGEEPATAERFMVVAANPHASQAGVRMLEAGGGAVDAAIAVQLVLSLVEPQSSGVGGGAFMLYFDAPEDGTPQATIVAYEGRETAPASATPDMFLDGQGNPMSFPEVGFGGLAVGVPGVMRMLEAAHREHGRLPWAALFAPAIELAERGFAISPRLHFLLDQFKRFARAGSFRAHYFDDSGAPYAVGHRLANPEYAATLRRLAERGADAMYSGALARAIVRTVRENDVRAGRLSLEDLERYEARRHDPLCSAYRRWRVCGPQLPSSGGVSVQQMLGILSHFDLAASRADPPAAIHLIAEAARLAFADRARYLADADFVDVPVAGLLDPSYLERRASLIDAGRAMQNVTAGEPAGAVSARLAASPPQTVVSTSHFSIVDPFGDAVSMTTSVQSAFGSQLMVGGFLLNNQLTDFAYEPTRFGRPVANRIEPRKRPLSSMAPTFVLDAEGGLYLVIGSPGGTRIINYVAQAIIGVLDFGLSVQDAIAAPHFVAQNGPIELEAGTSITAHAAALEALGHRVLPRTLNSGLHGIAIERTASGTRLVGGIDPRREGVALGR